MPRSKTELAVVGAGPAGLAAAVTAADLGLTVTLLDAGARPGGQYYRHPAPELAATRPQAATAHHDHRTFTTLLARLRSHQAAGRISYLPHHHVWSVTRTDPTWTLHTRTTESAPSTSSPPTPVTAPAVLLATGSYERHLPFPGWTLPGVVGAGGAQAMLKGGLVLPGRRIVVAGSGPLLLAVAGSLAGAGARVPAVVEAAAYTAYATGGAAATAALLRNPAKLAEGARHGAALLRAHTRLLTRHAVVEAHGTDRVEAVTVARLDRDWRPVPGTSRRIPCDALAVGHGLVPELSLATALGCATRTAPDDTVALALDADLRTSVPGVWSAGETGGIGGAQLAVAEGTLAAHSIAHAPAPTRLRRTRTRLRAFADVMGAAHRPGTGWQHWLPDATDVCRCEEVPAGRIREALADLGARDARTVKLLTRAGMGWCQGRMCGPAVSALCATADTGTGTAAGADTGATDQEQPAPDRRPLACPVPLRDLAQLPPPAAD
ncbi:NAD(P)/FAD-dependent oxidoreductase [Streptomyces sp. SKN60]|uniref:FAD/NAD(P)-dependent oxidoreductase n=1 Tax=Streptomyces sp. SKN60 TaxID=2855506 RepID=UPI00224520DE|nr:NAD(P)/FAD-dependent oxidoreductase [Streptomyces sp. SKN60]MCX2180728.1 NAD(P)/FAD-dependent oxidoreductase [Streptomyces sp. SKN60]